MILDRLKKRLYDAKSKKKVASGSMSYHMSSGGYTLNPAKPLDYHLSFSSMGQKLFSLLTSSSNLHDCKCTKKLRLKRQDTWNLI
jgi:hypothetical protein